MPSVSAAEASPSVVQQAVSVGAERLRGLSIGDAPHAPVKVSKTDIALGFAGSACDAFKLSLEVSSRSRRRGLNSGIKSHR
jgi:hypothetical protein